jgi:hypothetical protein
MHTYLIKFVALLFALAGISYSLRAQTNHPTVGKSFSQNIACTPSTIFSVMAEKAKVSITGWSNNYIQAKINFTASHPDKQVAQRELEYMRYAFGTEKNLIELRNIFVLPGNIDHIQSKLEVRIELMVPAKNQVEITNKYGNITAAQLTGKLQLVISFGDLQLADISGQIGITAAYSDIRGTRISAASLRCTDEKSKVSLDLEAGSYSFNSTHGDIDLAIKRIQGLTIQATRTDITIRPENTDACRYKITNKDGALYVPEKYTRQLIKKGNQTSLVTTGNTSMPLFTITSNYNSVTIK